jgi:hypothetical protein
MSQRDDHWEGEDEDVARRLRDGRPRISAFALDGIKTTVMARVRPTSRKRPAPRSRLLVAMLTVGLMVAGTAGTVAASNSSLSSGTSAAQSQYKPPRCTDNGRECKCSQSAIRVSKDRCVCPANESFAQGSNDCVCPNGSAAIDGKCGCPNDQTLTDDGRCVVKPPPPPPPPPTHHRRHHHQFAHTQRR